MIDGQANRMAMVSVVALVMLVVIGHGISAQAVSQLTLLHCWGEHRSDWVDEMVQAFEAAYGDVEVVVLLAGCGTALTETFLTMFAGGTSPDVVMVHTLDVPALAESGVLQSLRPFIDDDGISVDMWYPTEIASARWEDEEFGLPIRTGGDANSLLYYNRSLFMEAGLDADTPPRTWAELQDVSRRLIRYDGEALVQAAYPSYGGGDHSQLAILANGEGVFMDEEGRHVLFGESAAINAATFFHDYLNQSYLGGKQEFDQFIAEHQGTRQAFNIERLAMQANGSWEFSYIREANPDLDLGIALRPGLNEDSPSGMHAGTFVYSIPTSVTHTALAWELVKWLTVEESTAGHFMLRQDRPSPIIAYNANPDYYELNPQWDVIGLALSTVQLLPVYPPTREMVDVYNRAFNQVIAGQEPAESALPEAARIAQSILDKYWEERR